MATSNGRNTPGPSVNVNLHCAQCETQIGIFNNEWIRLTSSYARSKDKGTHFGTEVGERTQVVPSGPAQRSAEGCCMAEVFCRKCSNMVGQYCKSAPDPAKQSLVDQYFYKLTRTFLKGIWTKAKVEPVFGYGRDIVQPASSRSSMMARSSMTPTSQWADTPLRQSSRTPLSVQGNTKDTVRQEPQGSNSVNAELVNAAWQQSTLQVQKLQEQVQSHSEQITSQALKFNDQDERMNRQDATMDEHDSCQAAQAARIVELDGLVTEQTKRLHEQQTQLLTITNQLSKLQKSMNDLRSTLQAHKTSNFLTTSTSEPANTNIDPEAFAKAIRNSQDSTKEIESLRAENRAMKTRLSTIASAMGATFDAVTSGDTDLDAPTLVTPSSTQNLGKRKRNEAHRLSSSQPRASNLPRSRVVQPTKNAEHMPTPQSSDGGHSPPVQILDNLLEKAASEVTALQKTKPRGRGRPGAGFKKEMEARDEVAVNLEDKNPEAMPKDAAVQDDQPPSSPKTVSANVKKRDTRTTAASRRSRLSRTSDIVVITDTEEELSLLPSPNVDDRRVTRAASRAAQVEGLGKDYQAAISGSSIQPSSPMLSPPAPEIQVQDEMVITAPSQPSLPTVHVASNVLGINLGALIASSQALVQIAESPKIISSTTTPNAPQQKMAENEVQGQSSLVTQLDILPGPNGNTIVTQDTPASAQQLDELEIVQDDDMNDYIDSSDDDDDLMQSNAAAFYGDDSALYGSASLAEWEGMARIDSNDANFHNLTSAPIVPRSGRSMAPEPVKKKKKTSRPPRTQITLDNMFMATPQIFSEAYAAGRRPKDVRPPNWWTGRERDLNNELIKLGLSEWIGKNKSCKEYRTVVTAARARFRNYSKAAFLWSKGLDHRLSEPSSMLPETPVMPPENVPQNLPLSNIENVPGRAATLPTETDKDQNHGTEDDDSENLPRATRAHTRRSSMSLLSGLGEAANQVGNSTPKQRRPQRKSEGKRQSKRTSDIVPVDKPTASITFDQMIANHVSATLRQKVAAAVNEATAKDNNLAEDMDLQIIKPPTRGRGRPRKSGVPQPVRTEADEDNENEQAQDEPALTSMVSSSKASLVNTANVVSSVITVTPLMSEAQLREEVIRQRDRMAKELMEREDIDM